MRNAFIGFFRIDDSLIVLTLTDPRMTAIAEEFEKNTDSMQKNIEGFAKLRVALAICKMKKNARTRAETDLTSAGTIRNVSAWLSRKTRKNYEALLVAHLQGLEKERNKALAFRNSMKLEVQQLQSKLSELEAPSKSANLHAKSTIASKTTVRNYQEDCGSLTGTSKNSDNLLRDWGGDLLDLVIMQHAKQLL